MRHPVCNEYGSDKILNMSRKLTSLVIKVPYKRAGNVITQEDVIFELFREVDHYKLVPCLSEDELRIANLPQELKFTVEDGKPVSLRGKMDGNYHVITDAVNKIREQIPTL